jgi:hypothetical protein
LAKTGIALQIDESHFQVFWSFLVSAFKAKGNNKNSAFIILNCWNGLLNSSESSILDYANDK